MCTSLEIYLHINLKMLCILLCYCFSDQQEANGSALQIKTSPPPRLISTSRNAGNDVSHLLLYLDSTQYESNINCCSSLTIATDRLVSGITCWVLVCNRKRLSPVEWVLMAKRQKSLISRKQKCKNANSYLSCRTYFCFTLTAVSA